MTDDSTQAEPASAELDMDTIRQAARSAVEMSSLRSVARDTGMSPSGLARVLEGGRIYPSTVRRLTEWYLRTMGTRGEHLKAGTVSEVLRLLTEHLPPEGREAATKDILRSLRSRTAQAGIPLPSWLRAGGGSPFRG